MRSSATCCERDLVQVVRCTLLPLVQNGGRSGAFGERCIDLVLCSECKSSSSTSTAPTTEADAIKVMAKVMLIPILSEMGLPDAKYEHCRDHDGRMVDTYVFGHHYHQGKRYISLILYYHRKAKQSCGFLEVLPLDVIDSAVPSRSQASQYAVFSPISVLPFQLPQL
ncbi:hypothetical protein ACQJBY_050015 [Aegilops geniculata]